MRLQVELLGRGSVRVDGSSPVHAWPRPAARRLVSLLALSPAHRRTRDELADLLAPHLPPDRAARSVSKALSQARSVLGREVLDGDRTAVWIADGVEVHCDLAALRADLERLLSAPASPQRDGALASRLHGLGSLVVADDPYEEWAVRACDEVSRLVAEARLVWARSAASATAWKAVADQEPANEEAALALANEAAARGDRDAAVRVLDRCRAALEAMRIRPSASFVRTATRLLAVATPRLPTGTHIHGRDPELARVVSALRASSGALVAGPAGIGKTALVGAAAGVLRSDGWHVGVGTAVPDDRLAAMAALRAAVRDIVGRDNPLERRLADGNDEVGGGADALVRLGDDLRAALPPQTLLVVDDLQWGDPAMQRLLVRLVALPGPGPVVLLGGRSDEPDAPLPDVPSHVLLETLGPVTGDAAVRIVRDEWPDAAPGTVADLIERGQGNPYFLVELARAAAGPDDVAATTVPDAVTTLLRRRLDPLPVAARRLLEVLALLGEDAAYDVLAAADIELGPDGSHLDELLARRLLREERDGPRLVHPLLRDAVLAETNALRRASIREHLADALERTVAAGGVDRRLAAAHHRIAAWLESRLPERAQEAAKAGFVAGRQAESIFAHEAAETMLRGALEAFESLAAEDRAPLVADATDAWIELGHLIANRQGFDEAAAAYRAALGLAPNDRLRARAWRAIAYIPYRRGELQEAESIYRVGLDGLGDDPMASALLQIELGWVLHRTGRLDEAVDVLAQPAVVVEEAGEWSLAARALDRLGVALEGVGRVHDALITLDRALAASRRTGNARMRAVIEMHLAAALRAAGRAPEALVHARESARLSDEIGDPYNRSVVHWVTAEVLDELGDLGGALAERDAEVGVLVRLGNDFNLAGAHAHRSTLLSRLGRHEESSAAADAAIAAATRVGTDHLLGRVERRIADQGAA